MKKLMIAAAIVCAAAFAQAATISWGSGAIYLAGADLNDSTTRAGTGAKVVTMLVYEFATKAAYDAASSMTAAQVYDTYYGKTVEGVTKIVEKNSTGAGAVTQSTVAADSSGIHYAAVLFVDASEARVPDGKDAIVKSTFTTVDVAGSGTYSAPNLATSAGTVWTAVPVPEPTSGLLLLLGVAGMALKRKRA
jgi:hypothetical protein